ncbi:MAG: single-stranded-DNA-specific exonuclease RecJ, partial [Candidatus Nealsonbacteria bacterium CG_4_10_14_0_2_um_filter_35_20]
LGSVASRICRDFKKPVFLFQIGLEWSRGTVRALKGQNAVKAMESCGKLFKTFGGHPLAAGFCIENKNLEKFKECLIKYFR